MVDNVGIAVGISTPSQAVQKLFPLAVSLAVILNFGSGTMSSNVRSDMDENVGIADGIATPSFAVQKLFPLPVSLAAMLNFGSPPSSTNVDQRHPTSADVLGVKSKSAMVENLEAAVGIALQYPTV